MPRYTYRCPEGHEREVTHGMHEEPEILCNLMHDAEYIQRMERVIHAPASVKVRGGTPKFHK